MKDLTIDNICSAVDGTYTGPADLRNKEISAVTTDSRRVTDGCLFVPIVGEKVDGHSFIPKALEGGAALTLSEKEEWCGRGPCIFVQSTEKAVADIARFYLSRLSCKVVSVTGSVGKTSTKETVAAVLSRRFRTKKTPGNLNNALGLPFSIFTLDESDEIAVLEMGINHFGEMEVLGSIAPPDMSIITNIGECHLEFLGDRDGVFRAKTAIFDYLKEGAPVILNGDDDKLRRVKEVHGVKPVFYGLSPENDVWADGISEEGMEAVRCRIHLGEETFPVRIPYPGMHMVMNALCGAAAGRAFGLSAEEIAEGIASLTLPDGRLHKIRTKTATVIDDCYNANPMSMKASLRVLAAAEGRKTAIIGDMGELGSEEARYHTEVGEAASSLPVDLFVTVGPLSRHTAAALAKAGRNVLSFDTTEECVSHLPEFIKEGTVLVKASHFMEFDRIVEALTKEQN